MVLALYIVSEGFRVMPEGTVCWLNQILFFIV